MIPGRAATIESSFQVLKGETTGTCSGTAGKSFDDFLENVVCEEEGRGVWWLDVGGVGMGCRSASC